VALTSVDDPFTGWLKDLVRLPGRPGDPDISLWSATLAPCGPRTVDVAVGGAGWDDEAARLACVGEAIERLQPWPQPDDLVVESSLAAWPLDEEPLGPSRWVLFHPGQYGAPSPGGRDGRPSFPFRPFTPDLVLRWAPMRRVADGEPVWVPEEMLHLYGRPASPHRLAPGISTGLSCGRGDHPTVLRGLQEVIERDALMGAWFGRYPLEEWPAGEVLAGFVPGLRERVERNHLALRFYRVASPFSSHVTVVTTLGPEREGSCFSAGAACRETRAASWLKSTLEALQGRPYVRWLLARGVASSEPGRPADFSEHATFFSRCPERLADTPLARACAPARADLPREGLPALAARLGPDRPVLVADLTPPSVALERAWRVVRVVVPGLQPMHGNHALPLLGGPLWAPRGLEEWAAVPPHPFP
jgi:ribosomal protein S12 methylthiotransferase accessory factor